VVRKAEPGTIEKKSHQMLWGKPVKTGDRSRVSQSPTVWIANSNVKSTACFRVSSMLIGPIVARDSALPNQVAVVETGF